MNSYTVRMYIFVVVRHISADAYTYLTNATAAPAHAAILMEINSVQKAGLPRDRDNATPKSGSSDL